MKKLQGRTMMKIRSDSPHHHRQQKEKGVTQDHESRDKDEDSSQNQGRRRCFHPDSFKRPSLTSCREISNDKVSNIVTQDKKPAKFSSSTVSAGFMRSLKKLSSAASGSSKKMPETEVSAYDLIKDHFRDEDDVDDNCLLDKDNVHETTTKTIVSPSKGSKFNSLRISSQKSEYLSSLRIAGQGVKLFAWHEPHSTATNNCQKSPPPAVPSLAVATTTSEAPSSSSFSSSPSTSSKKQPSSTPSSNGFTEHKSSSSPPMPTYILVPEPDYETEDKEAEPAEIKEEKKEKEVESEKPKEKEKEKERQIKDKLQTIEEEHEDCDKEYQNLPHECQDKIPITITFDNNLSKFKPVFRAQVNSTSKSNKIVIDVPPANPYDTIAYQNQFEEHIYEDPHLLQANDQQYVHHLRVRTPSTHEDEEPRSMFDGASKDEILEYLEDAKERVSILIKSSYGVSDLVGVNGLDGSSDHLNQPIHLSCPVLEDPLPSPSHLLPFEPSFINPSSSSRRNRCSNVSNSSTDSAVTTGSSIEDETIQKGRLSPNKRSVSLSQLVERNDSGVGTETSKPNLLRKCMSGHSEMRCTDCEQVIDPTDDDSSGIIFFPLTCQVCDKNRSERKEIISEFVDTEFKYGRDLRIIKEEFYRPMEVTGLMTKDQLKSVFINLDELIQVNSRFAQKLEDALEIALDQGDEVRNCY